MPFEKGYYNYFDKYSSGLFTFWPWFIQEIDIDARLIDDGYEYEMNFIALNQCFRKSLPAPLKH